MGPSIDSVTLKQTDQTEKQTQKQTDLVGDNKDELEQKQAVALEQPFTGASRKVSDKKTGIMQSTIKGTLVREPEGLDGLKC